MARLRISSSLARSDASPSATLTQEQTSNRRAVPRSTAFSRSPSRSSDKENQPYLMGDNAAGAIRKGKTAVGRSAVHVNGSIPVSKKRRLGEHSIPTASQQTYTPQTRVNDYVDLQFYDPDQDPEERRRLRQQMRENERELLDRRDELVLPENNTLLQLLIRQDDSMKEVRQTSDATIDSRFLVNASDIALKKAQNMALGDNGLGIDVDEFVSKCITFMRAGGTTNDNSEPTSTQRRRNRGSNMDEDEEEFEDGDGLDWQALGSRACFPNNKRPPVPSFLLGPLSVQKRARTIQRRARIEKNRGVVEMRPDELKAQDLQKAETSNLTTLCRNINEQLKGYIEEATSKIDEEANNEEEMLELLPKYRLAIDKEGEAGVRLLDFAINPHSFGQSVENLFYISFLIRDGSAEVCLDDNGEAVLKPQTARTIEEQREQDVSKNQSIFGLDWSTWKAFIRAYSIQTPLIPHRDDEEGTRVTANGWYS